MADLNLLLTCIQGNQPASPPTTVYLKVGGTATGASCFSILTPCGTLQNAMNAAASVVQGVNVVTVSVQDVGPYVGGAFTYSSQRGGSLSSSNRGYPPLIVQGMGAPVVITEDPVTHCVICASNGFSMELINVDLQKGTNGGFMLLVAGYSQTILENSILDSFTNNVKPEGMIDAEVFGAVQLVGTLTVNGATGFMMEGEDNGQLLMDSPVTITCGPNYSQSQSFVFLNHSILDTESSPNSTYVGCPTSGIALQANGNSQWKRNSSSDDILAGNAYRIGNQDTIAPVFYSPSLTACTSGAIRSGSSNYSGWIEFTGTASGCDLNFGKPASFTSYFSAAPSCAFSANNTAVTGSIEAENFVEINGSFVNGTNVYYICAPFNGG
jgi:hypothetical protein